VKFRIRKKDLITSSNLKQQFKLINRHLYGKLKYTDTDTRARSKEIINLLLCKLVDEKQKSLEEYMEVSIKENETKKELHLRIRTFFEEHVKKEYIDIIGANENINLSEDVLYYVIKELQAISLVDSSKDVFSDAFEVFVSRILKEEGGQFFTPSNVVKFIINYLDPEVDSLILDPACGHGGFLLEVKELLWRKILEKDKDENETKNHQVQVISNLHGIDKDLFLTKICKLYLEILSGGKANIFCENSLDVNNYKAQTREFIQENKFDYIMTNPPFGAKIPIDDKSIQINYKLAHSWKNVGDNTWVMRNKLAKKSSPQVLFIERCIQLLKDGGKMGIILPEGIFGNPTDRYIWEFLEDEGKILGVISLEQNTFQPYTCNKTSILFFQKQSQVLDNYKIDFAIVNNIGHDKDGKVQYKLNKDGSVIKSNSGNPIINDDLLDLHLKIRSAEDFNYQKNQLVFKIDRNQIKNKIYIPNYYIGVERTLKMLSDDENFTLLSIKDLTDKKIIESKKSGRLPRGDEIGSQKYGLGTVPFIRTSDIYNWEVNLDSHKKTSEEVYLQYKDKQNIEVGDILLVKDGGPNLIGNTAYITELDRKIIIQSHIYKIKVLENGESIDSFLMLYLLNLDLVQKQIEAITFVQGTIASIGNRIMEITLPIPVSIEKRKEISKHVEKIIEDKTKNRKKIRNLSLGPFN